MSELGRLTNINKSVISKLESGETKRPELKTLRSYNRSFETAL
ncbi:hypothetical protein [Brevibacillus laterosporus]